MFNFDFLWACPRCSTTSRAIVNLWLHSNRAVSRRLAVNSWMVLISVWDPVYQNDTAWLRLWADMVLLNITSPGVSVGLQVCKYSILINCYILWFLWYLNTQIAKFMGPTWGPPGCCRPQIGPMLAPWTLLSGYTSWLLKPMTIHQARAYDVVML